VDATVLARREHLTEQVYARSWPGQRRLHHQDDHTGMPTRSGRYGGTDLQHVQAQHTTIVGRLVMLHRLLSADDRDRLLELFPGAGGDVGPSGPL
jgi:hypothetical protein